MQTFLIIGPSESVLKKRALKMAKNYQASRADTLFLEPGKKTSIIYINQVREVKRRLFLTPFNSPCQVAIIHQVQKATVEAQNALLKLLEEPPDNTYIILTANRAEELLPTVVSRCQIIKVKSQKSKVKSHEFKSNLQLLTSILQSGVGERLVIAQKSSASRNEAISWCQKTIIALREILIHKIRNPKSEIRNKKSLEDLNFEFRDSNLEFNKLTELIPKLQKALRTLEKTNTNVRLLIENLLLEFPKFPILN